MHLLALIEKSSSGETISAARFEFSHGLGRELPLAVASMAAALLRPVNDSNQHTPDIPRYGDHGG